jgi:mgtE-like transporter
MLERSITLQGLVTLLFCAFLNLGAGGLLSTMEEHLTAAGLVLMVPPLLGLRGNISGALASRLGTGLHTGLIPPRLKLTREVKINLASSLILSAVASITIGILSYVVGILAGIETIGIPQLVAIAFIAGLASGLVLCSLAVVIAVASYRRGWDPDNLTAPLMTTVGDFVTVICIALAVLVVI